MAKRMKLAIDAVEILHRWFYEGKPARLKNLKRRVRTRRSPARFTN
jgi:hypothetical protein